MTHKAGFVAVAGRPSAGKSTLINGILKTKLSIVSPRPQTTRHKILGFLNGENYQAVFVDTPGWLDATQDRLQDALRRSSASATRDEADLVLWVADKEPKEDDLRLVGALATAGKPMFLVLSKVDLPDYAKRMDAVEKAFKDTAPWAAVARVSGLAGNGVDALVKKIVAALPESPEFYPKDQLSDRYERFFALELIREQVFEQFDDEIPHACAVELDQFREETGRNDKILATLVVERDGQKAILIGKGGRAISKLRQESKKAIEKFLGRPVDLELFVKVRKDWRKDPKAVKEFGYGELDS